MIRIVNLRDYKLNEGEVLIKVDRSSILGNPFYMKSELERNKVCYDYKVYFDSIVMDYLNSNNPIDDKSIDFIAELHRILSIAKEKDIALGCWCYPKRCHSETILKFINKYMEV